MPTTSPKKYKKNFTDTPDGDLFFADDDASDAPNTSDDDAVSKYSKTYPYSTRNHNYSPNATDVDAAPPDDAASPEFLIDSKLKHKIDPRSMI